MKSLFKTVTLITALLGFVSCERHSWEDDKEDGSKGTKRLYPQEKKSDSQEGHH